ncbi:MAG: hypothetical protein N3E45_07905 [Oscillatoriaceae bacterium SKW80]|nr:hypothetical protein [Oscillatoriaceae bacterium SKYG93]MCX8120742.1 hypothetical protein [Oscillatoriaceae bacterium SKW80]MDW8453720.1 hypothetical protein [Oscillatoriaceae cyanobacterium SKYGB_i_bin93]HIK26952.1 hypothetical protein [Oscillatoriaceae cyanobacterium M7585_C2015_266]
MLYLALVQKKGFLGKTDLKLLACQKSEGTWAFLSGEEIIISTELQTPGEGVFVLVEISTNHQINSIQNATNWVLELIQQYLVEGLTPAFLQQETKRVEQWRQSLTLQSQELSRRAIEIEARREQLQNLEEELKREKKKLESIAAKLKSINKPSP